MQTSRSIVTGGTRGIGRAVAQAMLAAGGCVMIAGRDRAGVDRAVAALNETAGAERAAGMAVDVRDPQAAGRLVDAAVERFGGLDVLVNNAGVGASGPVEATTDEAWRRVIDTNLSGPFHLIRAAIPRLREAGGGWIVNVASLAGANPFAGGGAYCASKAALIALSEAVMQEVRQDGIRVSVVLPGSVATEFSGTRPADDSWKLSPDDVAQVVMDLLAHDRRSLPSRVEIRPSRPRKG